MSRTSYQPAKRPRWSASALFAAAVWCALAGVPGCATDGRGAAERDALTTARGGDDAAEGALRALARAQRTQPNRRAMALGPPPGIDPLLLDPIPQGSEARRLATMTYDGALSDIRAGRRAEPAVEVAPTDATGDQTDAVRLYASGRQRLHDGDADGAVRDLERAAVRDPGSPSVWRALGEAQMAAGHMSGAMISLRRAVALGHDDAQVFAMLGRHALRVGDHAEAVFQLARVLESSAAETGPALRTVALVDIADALHELGYLGASAEAVRRAIESPARISGASVYRSDLAAIVRRAGDLWRRVGDDACRLGDYERAMTAYARASESPTLDPGAIGPRRVHASLRLGRSADAALAVLHQIRREEGRTDARLIGLIRHLSEAGERESRLLADAIASVRRTLSGPVPPSITGRLVRAQAAALPDAEARGVLRAHLRNSPGDAETLAELLGRAATVDLAGAAREVVALTAANPLDADTYAAELLRLASSADAALAALPQTGESALVRAFVLIGALRPDEAAEAVAGGAPRGVAREAWVFAQVAAASAGGRWNDAERALSHLDSPSTAAERIARVRALRAMQRYGEALREMQPLLGPEAGVDALLRGSELYLGFGRAAEAESLLANALRIDPHDERIYEGLMTLYQAGDTAEDQQKLAAVARELREAIPSSRLLRWLAAQELAQRGLLDEAERSLIDLASEGRGTDRAVDLLVQIWDRVGQVQGPGALADAEAWVRSQLSERPANPTLIAALARVMIARGEVDAGVSYLADHRGISPQIARLHEHVLRSVLGLSDEANGLALTRLAGAPPTIDNSLELAVTLVGAGMHGEAVEPVRQAVPRGATLTGRQRSTLLMVLAAVNEPATSGTDPDARDAALAMFEPVIAAGVELPWRFHLARIQLLDASPATPDEAFADAVDLLLSALPDVLTVEAIEDQLRLSMQETPSRALDEARADLAYGLAAILWSGGREDASLGVYRVALRHNPEHAWASNDLGYFLVERGEALDEAERLLETAHRLKPGEASIVDSIGWLRYRQGRLEDWEDRDGVRREGAITLLRRATTMPDGADNPTLHDHLGDALWAAGRHDEAVATWRLADRLVTVELTRLIGTGSDGRRERLTARHEGVNAKLRAVREGAEPPITPFVGDGSRAD